MFHINTKRVSCLLCLGLAFAVPAVAQSPPLPCDPNAKPFACDTWDVYPGGAVATCADRYDGTPTAEVDIDKDDDGLIEICYLEQVNAMRYQVDGSGYRASDDAAKSTAGCASSGCNGYELVRDLDFDDDASYRNTANKVTWTTTSTSNIGWPMIEGLFSAILEGNGHTIANLVIHSRDGTTAFIENLAESGIIRNFGLAGASVTSTSKDDTNGAILADDNDGTIINTYVAGQFDFRTIDYAAPLVGDNYGTISNSYINVDILGDVYGVFASFNGGNSFILNSYAIGRATQSNASSDFVPENYGVVENVYNAVACNADSSTFPLSWDNNYLFRRCYWDRNKWQGANNSSSGVNGGSVIDSYPFTTAEMQAATHPGTTSTDVYYRWSGDNWDFGTAMQYPTVKYTGDDDDNPACGTSQQPKCGTLLRGQRNNQPVITSPTSTTLTIATRFPTNLRLLESQATTLSVVVRDADDDPLSVKLGSSDSEIATATVIATDGDTRTIEITASGPGTAMITVTVSDGKQSADLELSVEVEANTPPTIEIRPQPSPQPIPLSPNSPVSVVVFISDDNFDVGDVVSVTAMSSARSRVAITGMDPPSVATITTDTEITYTLNGTEAGMATIRFTATDKKGETIVSVDYTVANVAPMITTISPSATVDEGATVSVSGEATDANDPDGSRLSYRWTPLSDYATDWIMNTNMQSLSFTVPDDFITSATAPTARLGLRLTVSDNVAGDIKTDTDTVEVIVTKTNAGAATSRQVSSVDTERGRTLTFAGDLTTDPDGNFVASLSYQWQWCDVSADASCASWMDISGASGISYRIGDNGISASEGDQFRVQVGYTDAQGYTERITSNARGATASGDIKIRTKVFLEGPLE